MKKIIAALALAVMASTAPAQAQNALGGTALTTGAIVGGVIGALILIAVISDDDDAVSTATTTGSGS